MHSPSAWAKPAQLVPIVAQNRTAAVELSATAAAASRAAGDALVLIDPDQLRLVDGQIDLAAIERIEQPFLDVQTAIDDLDATLDDVASPWLVAPLQDRLAELDEEIDDAEAEARQRRDGGAGRAVDVGCRRRAALLHRLHHPGGDPRPRWHRWRPGRS